MEDREKEIIRLYKEMKEKYPWLWKRLKVLLNTIWVIPLFIWFMYFLGDFGYGIPTQITAGDLLSYYGVILSTLLALITIIVSLEQYRSDKISVVKPYLQSSVEMLTSEEALSEFGNTTTYLIYPFNNEERVGISSSYSDYIFDKSDKKYIDSTNYVVFAYTLLNAGAGSAIGVEFIVNDLGIICPKFCVELGKNQIFIFIIGKDKRSSKINISFNYSDIYDRRKYSQRQSISIVDDNVGDMSISHTLEDQLSEPMPIVN